MSNEPSRYKLFLEQWKIASVLHRHMDQMAWQSLSYFAALNGALVSVVFLVWNSDRLTLGGKKVFSLVVATFSWLASLVWSKVQKRMQLYHSLRTRQAHVKEKALRSMTGDRPHEEEHDALVYDGKRVDEHKEVMGSIRCSHWGRASNHDLVFGLALILMIGWLALLTGTLFALLFPGKADPALLPLFSSRIGP